MNTTTWIAVATMVAIGLPAFATVIPLPTPHAPELSVYEVYNTLYGTAFTSNTDLDSMRIPDLQTFMLPAGEGLAVQAEVRYAELVSDFGYYAPAGVADNYHVLCTVDEDGFVSGNPAYQQQLLVDGEFAFFLDPLGEGAIWHSEQSLNYLTQDHMVAYSVDGQPDTILLAWEDLPLPDGVEDGEHENGLTPFATGLAPAHDPDADYNDLMVEIRFVVIPEPSTVVLLGLGIAGISALRLRKVIF